jgi:hypothetical protein
MGHPRLTEHGCRISSRQPPASISAAVKQTAARPDAWRREQSSHAHFDATIAAAPRSEMNAAENMLMSM